MQPMHQHQANQDRTNTKRDEINPKLYMKRRLTSVLFVEFASVPPPTPEPNSGQTCAINYHVGNQQILALALLLSELSPAFLKREMGKGPQLNMSSALLSGLLFNHRHAAEVSGGLVSPP